MKPLAHKIRPTSLKEFVGQEHLVGKGKPLKEAIEKEHLFSFILWGPPGTGKTTYAHIYADSLDGEIFNLSGVSAKKDHMREIVKLDFGNHPKIIFLDEIHRLNKAQQDFLLPYVESGEVTLIGATTENPSFEVISALLSRCRVFQFKPLTDKEIKKILDRTDFELSADEKSWLASVANGDGRQALTILENTQKLYGEINLDNLRASLQKAHIRHDKKGSGHYDTISAFIKSMRASQPDAALYYLSRMIKAGEDPKYIARRMVIFASEDVGMAKPTALVVANEVFRAVETVGLPEAGINLAHGVVYLSKCKKDRSAYNGYKKALKDVEKYGNLEIPLKIRNAQTDLMKEKGYGEGYEMYSDKSFLPEKIKNKKYYKGNEMES
ncbi:MAG: replication-associated recombination protein A [Patescibacteria group bacterium]